MRSEALASVLLRQWSRSPRPAPGFSTLAAKRRQDVIADDRSSPVVPFRKQLKEETKRKRAAAREQDETAKQAKAEKLDQWELTVGVEVHAQLNTERKLFSSASTSSTDQPNAHTALFDISSPGSQPEFQKATLLPALRAALALNCNVQHRSTFDRKHYFYQDQPAGYQITQYYAPLAKDGYIHLTSEDGIAPADGEAVTVGIKQIQLEQDTAKTIQQPDGSLLDFNRVGHPLIEIITLPHMHHPRTAAACVRKIQQVLQAVSSVTTGMELGGLRADVNVSVRPRFGNPGSSSYHGVTGLGTRTEIKNLSSFKAIEDAIEVERDRQIEVLEDGGIVEGETRGWSLGSTGTRKLRGKEGEVDYRYMPDPDLPPLLVAEDLVTLLTESLPKLPDVQTRILNSRYGLTRKDAKTLLALDGGVRLDYFQDVLSALPDTLVEATGLTETGRIAGNWTLHELGGLFTKAEIEFSSNQVPSSKLAVIIKNLMQQEITGKTAKLLLAMVFDGDARGVDQIIDEEELRVRHLSEAEYGTMAMAVIEQNPEMAEKVRAGQKGKLQWFVGQLIRKGHGRVDAQRAAAALRPLLEEKEG